MEYHISVNLFDTGFRQFFGHQFVGQPEIGHGLGGSSIKYNQVIGVFFIVTLFIESNLIGSFLCC